MSVVPKVALLSVASIAAALVALALVPRGGGAGASGGAGVVRAATPGDPPATEIAVLATARDADAQTTEVRFVRVDAGTARSTRVGVLVIPRGAVARGDVVPGARAVVVVADDARTVGRRARDVDFAATLYDVDETRGAAPLVYGVVHASRPLASVDGAVYVERGAPGVDVSTDDGRGGRLRVDALSIDAVDRRGGGVRTVYTWSGYALHLAGELGGELVVYRVAPTLAEIVAVERASGRSRVIAAVPPFARDFTVDAARRALVMSNRDDADARTWAIERIDLATGARTRLVTARDEAPMAFALPGGALAWSARHTAGASLTFGATSTTASARAVAPLGAGFDALAALSDDGAWALVAHEAPGGSESLAALHAPTLRTVPLTTQDERLEPVGFVGGTRAALR